jgi:2-dehydropantoate 2-reductase
LGERGKLRENRGAGTAPGRIAPGLQRPVKIAVVGCGAVGSYYGAQLCRSGQDVHFLLRSDYDAVRRHGVQIRSPAGDFRVHPHAARAPEQIGVSDLVLIALKTTANDQFPQLLPPLVGPRTAVVTLQNGLGNEEQLARLLPVDQILGGLCFVCLNRTAPGVIHHLDHGLVVLGEFQRPPGPRTHDLAALFQQAGVPCKVADNLARAHWEKLVWNIPFNGLGVAAAAGYEVVSGAARPMAGAGACRTTDQLLADPRWEKLVRELMHEVIVIARALGFDMSAELAEKQIARTRTMGAYKASTLLDFERGRPLELESLFLAPLREARRAGVAAPRLAALCETLKTLEARRSCGRQT